MGLSVEQSSIHVKTSTIANLEMRLMEISNERALKHTYSAAQTSEITFQKDALIAEIRAKYGYTDDFSSESSLSSEQYAQMMAECESVENDCQLQLDEILNQMTIAEERLDTQQVEVETQLEAERASIETWKEARDATVEECGYFDGQ